MTTRQRRLMIEQMTSTIERLTSIQSQHTKEFIHPISIVKPTDHPFVKENFRVVITFSTVIGECLSQIHKLAKE